MSCPSAVSATSAHRAKGVDAAVSACGGIAAASVAPGPGEVVVGHPGGQLQHVGRQERARRRAPARTSRSSNVAVGRRRLAERRRRSACGVPSGTTTRAPGDRRGHASGNAIGEQVEGGHRHRDRHEPSRDCDSLARARGLRRRRRRIARTFFMSSQTSRLDGRVAQQVRGVERRNQRGAAIVEDAAAQPRDRLGGLQQRTARRTCRARRSPSA